MTLSSTESKPARSPAPNWPRTSDIFSVPRRTPPAAPSVSDGQRLAHWNLKGLLFDLGDVFYDATVWRRWLLQLLNRMGMHARYRPFYEIWDRDYLNDVHCARRDYDEAFQAFLQAIGLTSGQTDEVVAASAARKKELEGQTRPLPGVRSTLEELARSGMVLGVLSDSESPATKISARLAGMGIAGPLQAIVSSADLGSTKPNRMNYEVALTAMGLPARHVAFVGHDQEELEGAAQVGLRTIAFNFDRPLKSHVRLTQFSQLLHTIGTSKCRSARG